MWDPRYVFFDARACIVSPEAICAALDQEVHDARVYVVPEPDSRDERIVYLESGVDDEFSADVWCESGDDVQTEITRILESMDARMRAAQLSNADKKLGMSIDTTVVSQSHNGGTPRRFNGMLSIIYNNDDSNIDGIHEAIERCLKVLVSGALYYPETGELNE